MKNSKPLEGIIESVKPVIPGYCTLKLFQKEKEQGKMFDPEYYIGPVVVDATKLFCYAFVLTNYFLQ